MDRQLVITLNMDRRQAEQSAEQFQASQKKRIAELLSSTEITEKVKSAVIERENQRRIQGGVAAAEAEKGIRSKSLNYAEIIESAKSKLIEQQNSRRVASMVQAMMTEDQRLARSLNERQVNEAAKSKLIEHENLKRVESALKAMQSEEDRIGRTLTDTEAAERAKAALVAKANKERVDAIVKSSATEEERVGRLLNDTEVAERAKAALIERTNKQKVDLATRSAMTEEQLLTKVLTKEEITLAARNNLISRSNQKRIDEETRAMDGTKKGWAKAGEAIDKTQSSIKGVITGYFGIQAAISTVKDLAAMWANVEKAQLAAGQAALDYEKKMREQAALRGETQASKVVGRSLDFAVKTGLNSEDADKFTKGFLGSLPVGLQKGNINEKIAGELAIGAGQMAARQGGDAGTKGDLAGVLGQFGKINSASHGLGQLEAIRVALTEGRGDDTPLTQQLLKVAGAMVKEGGVMDTLPELASLIGVTSLSAGETESGTRAEQLVRGLRGGLSKHGKAKGAEFSQADYLEGLGVQETDSLEAILGKIMPDLQKAKAGGRDVEGYLAERGFRSFEERRSLVEVAENYDVFRQRLAASRASQDGGAVEKANAEYMKSALGVSQVAENQKLASTVLRGEGKKDFVAMVKAEDAASTDKREDESVVTQLGDRYTSLFMGDTSAESGKQNRLEMRALNKLRTRAKSYGLSQDEVEADFGFSSTLSDRAGAYIDRFKKMGKDPFIDFQNKDINRQVSAVARNEEAGSNKEVVDVLKEIRDETRKQNEGKAKSVPTPIQARPRVQGR